MIEVGRTGNLPLHAPGRLWRCAGALVLIAAAFGVPVDHLSGYALILAAAVLIFTGEVSVRGRLWLVALAAVAIAAALAALLAPAPIAEGENVFLPAKPGNVFEREMPPEVYRFMKAEFDALYPLAVRCAPRTAGCWQSRGQPSRLYAFSADSVFDAPAFSRSVTGIDFSDPVRLRLGFVNDKRYNWYTGAPDVHRDDRDRRAWMGLWRWHIAMPWFVVFRFPADDVGARLCWRGEVLWRGADQHYSILRHPKTTCRPLAPENIGRDIFGIAIRPDTLAMTLHQPAGVGARLASRAALKFLAVVVVLGLLVRVRLRAAAPAFLLIALALIVICIDDASFIGGWRPFDGGDDGLFYSGTGRNILQHLMHGNVMAALAGGENVYYYGGPGLRYFRALEMALFGDTNLGYLSLVLALPFIVLGLFRRFLPEDFAWRLTLVFTALPIGQIFGSSFFHYAKWAARGFADPAAQILLLWGLWVIIGARQGSEARAGPAAGGALLLALAVFTKPIVAPIAGVVLGGAGLAALAQRQWPRVAGMCIGFLPVLLMPLHNWYFGHQFVLLSSNARLPETYVMPPSAYAAALGELLRLDFAGEYLRRALAQIVAWLSGPSHLAVFVPLHVAAVAVVAYVTVRGRDYDPWLRLIGGALLAEYVAAMIYAATPRYYFEMWLLTTLVVAVFVERKLPLWFQKRIWLRGEGALDVRTQG
jgi:hypothetical protein